MESQPIAMLSKHLTVLLNQQFPTSFTVYEDSPQRAPIFFTKRHAWLSVMDDMVMCGNYIM